MFFFKMKTNKAKQGYVMAGIGFGMIVFNAISYFVSDETLPAVGIIGLVFVAIGLKQSRQSN
jgi:hypothetical protein